MIIDDLKKSILQKAMQGKLSEQNPSDEPASELLKRIKEEKERLIKDGKIKKEKAIAPIMDEEKPFEIPSNRWWTKIEIISYPVWSKLNQIQSKEVLKDWKFPAVSQWQALIDGYSNDENKVIKDLPLIMFWDHTRNIKYIDFPFVISADWTKFFKPVLCNYKFVFYLTQYAAYNLRNRWYARHYWLLKETRLPLPPLEEQKRIVTKLDELLPLLEEARPLEEEIVNLEKGFPNKLRQAILQYAIQWKLVEHNSNDEPASELLKRIKEEKEKLIKEWKIKKEKTLEPITDEEKPFDIPTSWEWIKLGEIIDTNIWLTYSPSNIVNSWWVAVLRSNNIQKWKMDYSNLVYVNTKIPEKCMAKKWDLLVCARNWSKSLVWKSAIITQDWMAFWAFMALVRSEFNPYIQYFLMSPTYRHKLDWVNTETINQITQDNLKNTIFPLPPLEEQKRIVAKLDELLKLCDDLEGAINLS